MVCSHCESMLPYAAAGRRAVLLDHRRYRPAVEVAPSCPRCDSPNTKFCYYNNYSLSQPRHFCKTCRRYWTKGGALRNVPVGGGCRKNKRSRSAAAATASRLSLNLPIEGIGGAAEQQAASAARLGAFLGAGTPVASSPIGAADYQGAAAVGMMPLPRLHAPAVGQYVPFGEWPPGAEVFSRGGVDGGQAMTGAVSSSIASSIESLSFINQDLHWKLQQQRLATMFLGPPTSAAAHVDGAGAFFPVASAPAGLEAVPAATTSWFMDSSYVLPSPHPPSNTSAAIASAANCSISNGRSSGGGSGEDDNGNNKNSNCGSAIPAWSDMSAFAMLP